MWCDYRNVVWVLLVAALALTGCAEEVAAPSGLASPFSIYGIMNPRAQSQSLLVSPVTPLLYDYPDVIDAAVTSTDLGTGTTTVWSDSVVRGAYGQRDHVFLADLQPTFDSRHRVEVRRSDGAVSTVDVRIPQMVGIDLDDEHERIMTIHVKGDSAKVVRADVIYAVRWNPLREESPVCGFEKDSYVIPYSDKIRGREGSYRIAVDPVDDHKRVLAEHRRKHPIELDYRRVDGLALVGVQVRLLVAGMGWIPAPEHLESTDLSFPGIGSNVSNGFGFVGSGYNENRPLYPRREVVERAEFHDYLTRPPNDCEEYCTCAR